MPAADNTVVINRPRPEVFAFVADHENDPRWRSGVVDIKRASGEGQGAIYTQGVKGPMGRRIDADFEVTVSPNPGGIKEYRVNIEEGS